jgi:hypothetical protein
LKASATNGSLLLINYLEVLLLMTSS